MVQAYILIQTEVGKAREVATAIRDIPGVVRVDAVTGPYDVIVLTEARSVDELGKMIVSRVQLVQSITRTLTAVPTPGHTPGHVSILVTSGGERALVLGDAAHSPVQVLEPDWVSRADMDPDITRQTRRAP